MGRLDFAPPTRAKVGKVRINTRRHLHAAALRVTMLRKEDMGANDTGFRYQHDDQMRKQLRGVSLARFEALAGGG